MGKKLIILSTILCLFSSLYGFNFDLQKNKRDSTLLKIKNDEIIVNQKKDFEGIPWGTTLNNVKRVETRPLLTTTKNELDYQLKIDSLTAIVVYAFNQQRLDSVMVIFREEDNYNVYNVEYSDILYNLVDEMELILGEYVYSDTLKEKDIKRYPTKNPNTINSINFIWNFKNTRVTARRTNAPGIPIIIKYKCKNGYDTSVIKKDINFNKNKGWFFRHKSLITLAIVVLLSLRVFSRIIRVRRKYKIK